MKQILEDLIDAERALERACLRLVTHANAYTTVGNTNAADVCLREMRSLEIQQRTIQQVKGRLQALQTVADVLRLAGEHGRN